MKVWRILCIVLSVSLSFMFSCFPNTKDILLLWDNEEGYIKINDQYIISEEYSVDDNYDRCYRIDANDNVIKLEFIVNSGFAFRSWNEVEQVMEAVNIIQSFDDNPLFYKAEITEYNDGIFSNYQKILRVSVAED